MKNKCPICGAFVKVETISNGLKSLSIYGKTMQEIHDIIDFAMEKGYIQECILKEAKTLPDV